MKTTCKYCGVVDKPHVCPHKKRKTDHKRKDKKIYSTTRWRELREQVLEDYNQLCLWSLYIDGEIVPADEVHHITEILENDTLTYEYDNLIPLEFYQHKYVHELYKKDKKRVQGLLKMMAKSYREGDKTLGKYKYLVR